MFCYFNLRIDGDLRCDENYEKTFLRCILLYKIFLMGNLIKIIQI